MDLNNGLQKETKKELFANFDKLRSEINSLRNELNKVNNDKESWFSKKEGLSSNISKKIEIIKESRAKRDALTKEVKGLKEKRNRLNQEIKEKISELISLKNELKNLEKKSKIRDPYKLRGEIDKIEVKLETEAMPFEKEKELSKKLKQFKKMLSESSGIINISSKIKKLDSEINSTRKNTNATHNEIQKFADESQKLHEGMIKSSKEIDDLKSNEEEAFKNFASIKKIFNGVNNRLKEKLSEMGAIREKINKFQLEEDEKTKLEESILIKTKEQEIEEKIRTGKKLTTEDFLAFQEVIKHKKEL